MSVQAVQWALHDAPLPKSDPTARLILVYLGEKADPQGKGAYPQVNTLAHDLDLDPQTVGRVLKRLHEQYALLSKDGMGPQGQNRWALAMDRRRPEGSFDEFLATYRAKESVRKSRYRQRSNTPDVPDASSGTALCVPDAESGTPADVHDDESGTSPPVLDDESGTVPDAESGTQNDVPDAESVCPGRRIRLSRTQDPDVPDAKYPRNRPKNRQENRQENRSLRADADAPAAEDTDTKPDLVLIPAEDAEPEQKQDELATIAQQYASRYYEAMQKQVPFMGVRKVVEHSLKTFTPEQVLDGLRLMATEHRGRPLTRQTLLNAIESRSNGRPGGQYPFGGKDITRTPQGRFDLTGLSTGDKRFVEAEIGKDHPDWDTLEAAFHIHQRHIKEPA